MKNSTIALFIFVTECSSSHFANEFNRVDALSDTTFPILQPRALANAPNGYIPVAQPCPSPRPSIRSAASLSLQEASWLQTRRNVTIPAMREFLGRLNITGFDVGAYFGRYAGNSSALPNIGIAVSGGGYRATLAGAGILQAFDGREANATAPGHLGGLLQSTTYVSGLSGGSWLLGSLYLNNFTTVSALLNTTYGPLWEFENSVIQGPAKRGLQLLNTADYYRTIFEDVQGKDHDLTLNTTITDYWGRALSFQLINATNGGPGYTWSSIALSQDFVRGQMPMPIVIADSRSPGQLLISSNTTIYEFNPWELGTFDPTTYGFAPLEFLGSNFSGGVLAEDQQCVRGFDNAGYIMGTSSSLFNQFFLQINSTSIPTAFQSALTRLLRLFGDSNLDIASYKPNPFLSYHPETSQIAPSDSLTLVDGGEDLQNIPLHPLIQPLRALDVVFAIDSSADTVYGWPNGASLVATYERALNQTGIGNGTVFPAVPDNNTFVNLGLNARPAFFGCDAANVTTAGAPPSPLIVYLPNYPYVYDSNFSTFKLSYNTSERNAMVANGYHVATMANGTADQDWPTCVGCAILSRSWGRTGMAVPEACGRCFRQYCWDGRVNGTKPAVYDPKIMIGGVTSAGGWARRVDGYGLVGLMGGMVVVVVVVQIVGSI